MRHPNNDNQFSEKLNALRKWTVETLSQKAGLSPRDITWNESELNSTLIETIGVEMACNATGEYVSNVEYAVNFAHSFAANRPITPKDSSVNKRELNQLIATYAMFDAISFYFEQKCPERLHELKLILFALKGAVGKQPTRIQLIDFVKKQIL